MLLVIIAIVIVAVYAITRWQQARETGDLLAALHSDDHGEAMKAMAALRERGAAIQYALVDKLSSGEPNARWRAAMLLGEINTSAARTALEAALKDESDDVQLNAAMSLGKLGDRRAADALRDLAMNDQEAIPVRTAAVRALALLRSGPHLPEVAELASKRPPVYPEGEAPAEVPPDDALILRKAAVAALGILGAVAEPEVGERVLDSTGKGAATAAEATATVLAESASSRLEPNAEVRATACIALADLAVASGNEQAISRALRALIDALNDDSATVRIAAMDAINQIPAPADMQKQVEDARAKALSDPHYWVREAAAQVGG